MNVDAVAVACCRHSYLCALCVPAFSNSNDERRTKQKQKMVKERENEKSHKAAQRACEIDPFFPLVPLTLS